MNPLSGVLAQAASLYRAHASHLLQLSFVVAVVAAVLEAILTGFLGTSGALLAGVVGLVATFLLQAALVEAVQDVMDGKADLTFGETLHDAGRFLLPVAVVSVLAGIAIGVGLILFLIPGLFLLTFWCLVVPAVVLENAGIGRAFGRSQELVRGYGWHVFGTLVLVYLLLFAVNVVLGLILAVLPDAFRGLVSSILTVTLISPYIALVVTLAFFRLRDAQQSPGPNYAT
jgi:hypothetical protein